MGCVHQSRWISHLSTRLEKMKRNLLSSRHQGLAVSDQKITLLLMSRSPDADSGVVSARTKEREREREEEVAAKGTRIGLRSAPSSLFNHLASPAKLRLLRY